MMCCGLDKAAKLARPASEHAREQDFRLRSPKQRLEDALAACCEALAVVEQERAAAVERYDLMVGEARKVNRAWRDERDRRERVEQELAQLREALREISNVGTDLPHARRLDRDEMRRIARAALAVPSSEPAKESVEGEGVAVDGAEASSDPPHLPSSEPAGEPEA